MDLHLLREDEILALLRTETLNIVAALAYVTFAKLKRLRQRTRAFGVHPINRRRDEAGHYNNIYKELRQDEARFFRYTRMSLAQFDKLVDLVKPFLPARDVKFRRPMSTEMRLVITLRFLATGDNNYSTALAYRIGDSTCRQIVKEVCLALWPALLPEYVKPPKKEDFCKISDEFLAKWDLPHCLGAIDGKHIVIQKPVRSGSLYFCYKKTFSLVLMAICDANYCFTFVDVGHAGSGADSGIFRKSSFGNLILNETLEVPPASFLPYTKTKCTYFFVGDEAFPLKLNLMIPYGKGYLNGPQDEQYLFRRIFNYRLSRARRIIENCFGILAARWRIFHQTIQLRPDNAIHVTKACVALHNYLMKTKNLGTAGEQNQPGYHGDVYDGENLVSEGLWRTDSEKSRLLRIPIRSNRHACTDAKNQRSFLAEYLTKVLSLSYQENLVNKGNIRFDAIMKNN